MPLLLYIAALAVLLPIQQAPGRFPLKRFEVIRVNGEDLDRVPASVRAIFVDPLPDAELVENVEEATRRTGFTPRLPAAAAIPGPAGKVRFGVTDPVRAEARVVVA